MQGIAKALVVAIFISIAFLLFVRMVFFFPWYMTIVTEGFQLSQNAANDNYIKQTYYDDTLSRMKNRPIFREKMDKLEIFVRNERGTSAIGVDQAQQYASVDPANKPYGQRGDLIVIEIQAVYPLIVEVWGKKIEAELPVSFSLTAVGTKFYKDLPEN